MKSFRSLLTMCIAVGATGCGVMSAEDRSEGARLMTEEMNAREEMLARREEALKRQETSVRQRETVVLAGEREDLNQKLVIQLPTGECMQAIWNGTASAPIETEVLAAASQPLLIVMPAKIAFTAPSNNAATTSGPGWTNVDCPAP